MAGAVERAAEEAEFRAGAKAAMGTAAARADLRREGERFAAALEDELEPEDWSELRSTRGHGRILGLT